MPFSKNPVWTGNSDDTAFIFYQGRDSSQVAASKYVGNNRMGTTTGEIADFKGKGILTIPREHLWVHPELQEINRHPILGFYSQLKHWFTGVRVTRPKKHKEQLDYTPLYPQNESGSVHRYSVMNSKRSLGQTTDINDHQKRYSSLLKYHTNIKKIILYGVSRGAATTFSALAKNKYKKVELCVLEGPPSSIRDIFKTYFTRFLGKILYNKFLVSLILGGQHQVGKEHQAMGAVADFPNNIPLVIISSQKDWVVPHQNSINLALSVAIKRIAAQQNGEQTAPVYFLQLDRPGHNDYTVSTKSKEALRYQNFMHAVYKKHGLPYIIEYAIQGEKELRIAELTNGALKNQVQYQAKFKNDKPARKATRTQALHSVRNEINCLNPEDKERAVKICSAMPLYNKHRNPYTLFGKTNTQKNLETLLQSPVHGL